jgi:DNA-binding response OmpR family regulator
MHAHLAKRIREVSLAKFENAGTTDLATLHQLAARQSWPVTDDPTQRSTSYRIALGREAIQLGIIEFRILLFLASRPYHAFTRRNIADAVSSEQYPVEEASVERHISSLIGQLGGFHDYVQSVPYMYRFKA